MMAHRTHLNGRSFLRSLGLLVIWIPVCVANVDGQTPLLHWTFDEANGDALDQGDGVAANGVLQATATRTDDTPGGFSSAALDLSALGVDSWVNGGDPEKIDEFGQFTLTTWVKLFGWNDGGSGNQRLLAKQAGGPNYEGYSWNINPPLEGDPGADNLRMGLFVGGYDLSGTFNFGADYSEDFSADEGWTFLAVTYDGLQESPEDNVAFYIGTESSTVEQLGDPLTFYSGIVASSAGLANINVGMTDAAPGIDFSINGYQDDVRIYGDALTLEQLDAVRLENLTSTLLGDFNGNDVLDVEDINLLTAEVIAGTNDLSFDLNDDQAVNVVDRNVWVKDLRITWFGDANLDDEFNTSDLVSVFQVGKYEAGTSAGWGEGDWNGDGMFDSADFVAAFTDGGFELGPVAAVAAVPEPSGWALLSLGFLSLWKRRRGHSAASVPSTNGCQDV